MQVVRRIPKDEVQCRMLQAKTCEILQYRFRRSVSPDSVPSRERCETMLVSGVNLRVRAWPERVTCARGVAVSRLEPVIRAL